MEKAHRLPLSTMLESSFRGHSFFRGRCWSFCCNSWAFARFPCSRLRSRHINKTQKKPIQNKEKYQNNNSRTLVPNSWLKTLQKKKTLHTDIGRHWRHTDIFFAWKRDTCKLEIESYSPRVFMQISTFSIKSSSTTSESIWCESQPSYTIQSLSKNKNFPLSRTELPWLERIDQTDFLHDYFA